MRRYYVLLGAALGWFALALQLVILLRGAAADGRSFAGPVLGFLSYFTVLTNILVASALTAALSRAEAGREPLLARPGPATAIATYIAIVGIVYSLLLRETWQPTGAQLVADRLLHDVMPIVYLGYWVWTVPKGRVAWSSVGPWLAYPVVYAFYTLTRGAVIGRYPYPFLDAATLGYARVALNAAGLVAAILVTGLIFVAIDRALGRRHARASAATASAL